VGGSTPASDGRASDSPASESSASDGPASDSAEPVAPAPRRRRVGVLLSVALLAYLLDLGSKLLVVAKLEDHNPIHLLGSWVMLQATRNPGAAFGMGAAMTIVFTIIATSVVVVICRLARKLYSLPWAIALGLLLGGAFGNLTDRVFRAPSVFRGAVVDFISVKHFAVFNLADSAIVCGGILVVILSFLGTNPDGSVQGGQRTEPTEPSEAQPESRPESQSQAQSQPEQRPEDRDQQG